MEEYFSGLPFIWLVHHLNSFAQQLSDMSYDHTSELLMIKETLKEINNDLTGMGNVKVELLAYSLAGATIKGIRVSNEVDKLIPVIRRHVTMNESSIKAYKNAFKCLTCYSFLTASTISSLLVYRKT